MRLLKEFAVALIVASASGWIAHRLWVGIVVGVTVLSVIGVYEKVVEHRSPGVSPDKWATVSIRAAVLDGPALLRPSGDPWFLFYRRVEITNATSQAVSLNMRLRFQTVRHGLLTISENGHELVDKHVKSDQSSVPVKWLRCPLRIEGRDTVTGALGFQLPFRLWDEIEHGAEADLLLRGSAGEIEITENTSGEVIVFTVPGRYPATDGSV